MTDNEMIEVIKSGTISTLSAADKAPSKSMTVNERKQKQRDGLRERGLVKREVWIKAEHAEALTQFVKGLQ